MRRSRLSLALILVASVLLLNGAIANESSSPHPPQLSSPEKPKPHRGKQKTAAEQRGTEQAPFFVKGEVTTQKSKEERDTDAEERQQETSVEKTLVEYTGFSALFTLVLAVIALAQVGLFVWQLTLIRTSLNVAKESADTARTNAAAALEEARAITTAERAYVTLSHCPPGVKINDRGFFEITVEVKNHGRTPTHVTHVALDAKLLPPEALLPMDHECRPSEHRPNGFLVTDGYFFHSRTFPLRGQDLADAKSGMRTLWVFGYVDYIDSFNRRHRASYVRTYNPHIDDGKQNNLFYSSERRYNYDRPREPTEGNDWDSPA